MPQDRAMEYLDLQDAAADWQPITVETPIADTRPLVTYGEWLEERRRRGVPGGMAFVYLTECNWHGPNWLGQTCPACGAVVWERRGGRLDCHTCQVWWRDYDELDDARRVMTAADETIEVES